MAGPVIAHAAVKVDLEGKRIPSEARELGREGGEGMGEEFGDSANKEILDKFREGAGDRDRELGKGADKSGENYGIKFSDSMDKILKTRLRQTSDEVAKVFEDNDSLQRYFDTYKGAGDASDELKGKLQQLGDRGVLTGDDFDRLSGKVEEYNKTIDGTRKRNEDYLHALRVNSEELEKQDVAHRHFTESIDRMAKESTASIDRMVDEQARAFDERHGPSIDRAIKNQDRFSEAVARGERSFSVGRSGLSSFIDRLEDFAPTFQKNQRSFDTFGNSVEQVGRKTLGIGSTLRVAEKAFLGVGDKALDAGKKSGSASSGIKKLAGAFSNFDPSDNPGQLLLVLIALAPQVAVLAQAAGAGVLILAGALAALAAAGVGYGTVFSNLFGDLKDLDPAIRPAAKALQDFGSKLSDLRLNLQKSVLTPAVVGQFQDFGTKLFSALNSSFQKIAPALSSVLNDVSRDLNSGGFKKDLNALFTGFGPVIMDLGNILRSTFSVIGSLLRGAQPFVKDFTGELSVAIGKFATFLNSTQGKAQLGKFFSDVTPVLKAVGDAVVTLGSALAGLVTPTNIKTTVQVLKDLGNSGPGLAKFANDLNVIVRGLAGLIQAISVAAGAIGGVFDTLFGVADNFALQIGFVFSGINTAASAFVKNFGIALTGVGTALEKLKSGDVVGAGVAIKQAFDNLQAGARDFANGLGTILGSATTKFRALDSGAQASLNALAERFNVPKAKFEDFGGTIAEYAEIAGVSIRSLGSSKGWDDLQTKTGLSNSAVAALKEQFKGFPKAVSTTVKAEGAVQAKKQTVDFGAAVGALTGKTVGVKETGAKESTGRVAAMSAKIGAVVGKSVTVKETGAAQSRDRVVALSGRIGALAGKTVGVKESGAAASSGRVDTLRGRIGALAGKTVGVSANVSGAAAVGALAGAIAGLRDKTVNVRTIQSTRNASALGGVIAGGQQIAGGRRFAVGGIVRNPTYLGPNLLVGEGGPEAIVPLAGALSNIDPSVRGLAAAARGLAGAVHTGTVVEKGAITVYSNAENPAIVASQVIDRLIPLGG